MKDFWIKNNVFIMVSLVFSSILSIIIYHTVEMNNGHWVYYLDDAYIHMSISKNLALYGVWGIDPYHFNSASSSLLWTILLATLDKIIGFYEQMPLILNFLFSIVLIYAIDRILQKGNVKSFYRYIVILLLIAYTNWLKISISGMETILQAIIDLLYIFVASQIMEEDTGKKRKQLMLLSLLITSVRYEGIIIVLPVVLLFWIKKKRMLAIKLSILSLLPVVIFGIYSISQGALFFPNTLMVKGQANFNNIVDVIRYLFGFIFQMISIKFILIVNVILIGTAIWMRNKKIYKGASSSYLVFILLGMSFLHLELFQHKINYFRYNFYYTVLMIIFLVFILNQFWNNEAPKIKNVRLAYILTLSFVGSFAILSVIASFSTNINDNSDIYRQQYQMAKFIKTYYNHDAVALNDIGEVSYQSQANIIDLWGLANLKITRAKMDKKYNTKFIDQITKGNHVKIAMVYTFWYDSYGGLPKSWIKVGTWQLKEHQIAGGDTVSIYAVDQKEEKPLIKHLQQFSKELPDLVIQKGMYMN